MLLPIRLLLLDYPFLDARQIPNSSSRHLNVTCLLWIIRFATQGGYPSGPQHLEYTSNIKFLTLYSGWLHIHCFPAWDHDLLVSQFTLSNFGIHLSCGQDVILDILSMKKLRQRALISQIKTKQSQRKPYNELELLRLTLNILILACTYKIYSFVCFLKKENRIQYLQELRYHPWNSAYNGGKKYDLFPSSHSLQFNLHCTDFRALANK